MFLTIEGRIGGPLDPFTSFSDSVEFLFGKPAVNHPMFDLMHKLSYEQTPKSQANLKSED